MTDEQKASAEDVREVDAVATEDTAATEAAADSNAAFEVEKLRSDVQKNLEGWQRTLAEFQNYKRRTERETRDSYQNAILDVLKSMLPIIDDFERAMANKPDDLNGNSWVEGIALIQRKFNHLLEEYNVSVIDPVGQPFDPTRHEAIGIDEASDVEQGHVSTVLQKGYAAGEQVLRPATVKVAG